MTARPRIYLAGPDVFASGAVVLGQRLKNICTAHGLEGVFPLDSQMDETLRGLAAAKMISLACHAMVTSAEAVVANLSPWRGPHVDDGTAVEIGIAIAVNIPVFGYSTDLRPLLDRIPHEMPMHGTTFRDSCGYEIENFGQPFNAMIAGALEVPAFDSAEKAIAAAALHLKARG